MKQFLYVLLVLCFSVGSYAKDQDASCVNLLKANEKLLKIARHTAYIEGAKSIASLKEEKETIRSDKKLFIRSDSRLASLLEAADNLEQGKMHYTPIHWASERGDLNMVRALLDAGADPNTRDYEKNRAASEIAGYGPLEYAAASGHAKIVKALLKAGAKPLYNEFFGKQIALDLAVRNGRAKVAKILIKAGAIREGKNGNKPNYVALALEYRHPKVMQVLLDAGEEYDFNFFKKRTPLQYVLDYYYSFVEKDGDKSQLNQYVKMLLNAGADPNARRKLQYRGEVAWLRAAAGAEPPETTGETLFSSAVRWGDMETVKAFLKAGADPNIPRNPNTGYYDTPLHIAAKARSVKKVKLLLEAGADPNGILEPDGKRTKSGDTGDHRIGTYTPLMEAILGRADADADALSLGRDKSSVDEWKASVDKLNAVVALLLEAGAQPNITTSFGLNPLHAAAKYGYTNAVRLLLEAGADPNAVYYDDGGIYRYHTWDYTALHVAERQGHKDIVKTLLEAGADSSIKDKLGRTPLDARKRFEEAKGLEWDENDYIEINKD